MDPVTGAIIVSFVVSAATTYLNGKSKAKAAKQMAEMRENQAREIIKRSEYNVDLFRQSAEGYRSNQVNAAANSGIEVSSGNVLLALEDTNQKMQDAIGLERREAQWQANSARAGAAIARSEAKDIRSSFVPNLANAGVQAYGQYAAYKG